MIVDLIDLLQKNQQTVRVYSIIAIAIMLVWSFLGVDTHHAHTWMEVYIPGFWSIFTLLACVVLIFFSRWLGKSGLETREDYYDN